MKKMKWLLISIAGVLTLSGGGGWLALRSWLEANATPEAVIHRIEAEWNCRADLKSLNLSLFSNPARIELENLVIAPRDAEVGKPLAQRAPIPPGSSGFIWRKAAMAVDTGDLVSGRLHVKNLTVSGVWVREEVTPEGVSLMKEMFRKPKVAGSAQVTPPTSTAAAEAAPAAKPAATSVAQPATATASASHNGAESHLPWGLIVDEAVLEQMDMRVRNRQARTTTNLHGLRLRISAVDVDSANLAQHNQCKLEVSGGIDSSGRAKVGEETKDVPFADFTFAARGTIKPFDEKTKLFSPQGQVTLELNKDSVFGGTTTIGEAAGKDKNFSRMKEQFGIDVSDLVIGGRLQETVSTDVHYQNGRVEFMKEARFRFPDYTITLHPNSWINGAEDDHDMQLQLLPSEAVAKKITDGVTTKMGSGVSKLALSVFNDGQGHLAFDLVSDGRLSKPKFRLGGQAGAIEQVIKGLGSGVLKGLIGN